MPVAAILDRRLAAYSITAGMAIAGAAKASAAIVYTDIPDETFVLNDGAQAYILDINADGIDDFNLRFEYSTRATSAYACTNVAIRPIATLVQA